MNFNFFANNVELMMFDVCAHRCDAQKGTKILCMLLNDFFSSAQHRNACQFRFFHAVVPYSMTKIEASK